MATLGSAGHDDSSSSDDDEQRSSSSSGEEEQQLAAVGYKEPLQDADTGPQDGEEQEEPDFDPTAQAEGGGPAYEFNNGEGEGAFMMSEELRQLWEEVRRVHPAALLEEVEKDLQDSEKAPPGVPTVPDPETGGVEPLAGEAAHPDDYKLLLEAIQLYFTAAPVEDEELDGMNEEDREVLAMIGGMLQDELEGPVTQVVNTAPPGRLPWEILEADEEAGVVHWGLDLTEGKAQEPWRNALLSSESKQLMYDLHIQDPEGYSVENLAVLFRIRQQRVMAILALKQMEAEARAKGVKLQDEVQEIMDTEVHECIEAVGSGERHYAVLPSYPNYKELDTREVVSRLEAKLGKPMDQITEEDLSPELAREVLGVVSKEEVEEQISAREETAMVEEFTRNLQYNMGLVGDGIKRASRKSHAPRRPREGWGLVVTPLGETSNPLQQAKKSFVAQPDGTRRELTEDELLYLQRAAPRPRRKLR
ncbi:hypothetical protein N2152v2_008581 [Parachlorella kessleri]